MGELYDLTLFLVPFLVAYLILTILKSPEALDGVLKHFLNYAVVAILGVLISFWNHQLEQPDPKDVDVWIALPAFTLLSWLAGGFALANFWIGWRAIGERFRSTAFAPAIIWSLRVGYALLLLNVFFLWRYADTPLSK